MTSVNQELFPPAKNIYLLSHSIGRMPASAEQALQDSFFSHWKSNGEDIWDHWLATVDGFRSALAGIFNAPANSFCPQSNVSSGLVKVVQSLTPGNGKNVIVMCEGDFPSAGFVLQQAKAKGFELKIISRDADVQDIATWDAAMSEEVHSVFVTHVHYSTSIRVPVEEICALARSRGINSMVDIAQSAGVVPIDFGRWNADVVVGSCIKWLCGGPGAGYLWVNPEFVRQLEPVDVGWFSHANPFEFDINHFTYANDSARFWGGTPSVASYAIATNSIRLINDFGVGEVQRHNQGMIDKLTHSIDPAEIISPTAGKPRGGTLVINPDNRQAIEAKLKQAGVQYDSRATGLRLSAHIYNSLQEIEVVRECLEG